MEPVYRQAGAGASRSRTSAVLVGTTLYLPPPRVSTLPSAYMADVPARRTPNLRLGPVVHLPVPEVSRKRVACSTPTWTTLPSGATKILGYGFSLSSAVVRSRRPPAPACHTCGSGLRSFWVFRVPPSSRTSPVGRASVLAYQRAYCAV